MFAVVCFNLSGLKSWNMELEYYVFSPYLPERFEQFDILKTVTADKMSSYPSAAGLVTFRICVNVKYSRELRNENGASRPGRSEFGVSLPPELFKKLLNGGYFRRILNWFNSQQQQYRYNITVKLHTYDHRLTLAANKKTENRGFDFIRGHVIYLLLFVLCS